MISQSGLHIYNILQYKAYYLNQLAKCINVEIILTKKNMRNLYISFIYPYLTYCVEIWRNAYNIHLIDPIVKLQKIVFVL